MQTVSPESADWRRRLQGTGKGGRRRINFDAERTTFSLEEGALFQVKRKRMHRHPRRPGTPLLIRQGHSPAMVLRNMRYSKLDISRRCHFCVMLDERINWRGDMSDARLSVSVRFARKRKAVSGHIHSACTTRTLTWIGRFRI